MIITGLDNIKSKLVMAQTDILYLWMMDRPMSPISSTLSQDHAELELCDVCIDTLWVIVILVLHKPHYRKYEVNMRLEISRPVGSTMTLCKKGPMPPQRANIEQTCPRPKKCL